MTVERVTFDYEQPIRIKVRFTGYLDFIGLLFSNILLFVPIIVLELFFPGALETQGGIIALI